METKNFETLLSEMKNYMIANQSKVTDFNRGSVIMTMFEAIANIVEQAYIDTRNGYTNNLKQLATLIFNFKKKEGQKASVSVYFTRNEAKKTAINIPANTKISDGTHNFITTSTAVIKADEVNSNVVSATAEKIGEEYNVALGSINTIVSTVSGEVVAVTNSARASGGSNTESETEMLGRFKTYINGLQGTNYYGLKAGVLSLSTENFSVRSVGIEEHFPPITDDSDNAYNVTIYVDDGTGAMTDELKNKISDIVNGDGTSENPGLRAAGINVRILPANQVLVNISVSVKIYRTENALAQKEITETLTNFINGLEIGENVIISDLVMNLRQISYVTDVQQLKIGTRTLGTENIILGQNQIARMGEVSLTFIQ